MRQSHFSTCIKRTAPVGIVALLAVSALGGCSGGSSSHSSARSSAIVTTLAGAAEQGTVDGAPAVARFDNPVNVATDVAGNVFVCDYDSDRVRKIALDGTVSTLVNQANFSRPFGIALTPDGRLFVSTDANDLGARDGTTGTLWQVNLSTGAATVIARNLGRPRGLAALSNTQIVLADLTQNDVRLINPSSRVITPLAGLRGTAGSADGSGTAARFDRPYGLAIMPNGDILLADQSNNSLRRITPAGVVTTFAGTGTAGYKDGDKAQAQFNGPQDVDVDARGIVYVSDNNNFRIRRITPAGKVSTIAGDGVRGFREGTGTDARFAGQEGLALRRDGAILYVADGDGGNDEDFNRVRRLQVR